MKSEQIREITDKATEQLVAALNTGRSEALTGYLKAIGRFHRYSFLCAPQHRKDYRFASPSPNRTHGMLSRCC